MVGELALLIVHKRVYKSESWMVMRTSSPPVMEAIYQLCTRQSADFCGHCLCLKSVTRISILTIVRDMVKGWVGNYVQVENVLYGHLNDLYVGTHNCMSVQKP